jgi:hypothetical protein
MKNFGKIAICLAGGLALNAGLRAADLSPDNPYATIVTRNIFGLNPIPAVDPNDAPAPPVKITPNGIMTIFGHLQVLFKTAGGPGKEQSYILTEGQRQDDIEVVKINEKAGIVTFNNHGLIQELPLVSTPAASTPMPAFAAGAGGYVNPNGNTGGGNDFGARNGRFGSSSGRRGLGNGGNNSGAGNGNSSGIGGDNSDADNGLNLRNIPTRTYQPEASTMTPEQQALIIEAQRAQYQADGNPILKILPPPAPAMQRALNGESASPPVP